MDKTKARKLGAAFKKGYPPTYLKSQTKPIYRKTAAGQKQEIERLAAVRGLPFHFAYGIIRKKYLSKNKPFLLVKRR